ncbi:MAG: phage portal protein [Planctomycetota bacterium]
MNDLVTTFDAAPGGVVRSLPPAPKMLAPEVSGTENPRDWFVRSVGGDTSDAGVRVDRESALTLATWWQAILIIAGDVAALPINLYRWKNERTKVKLRDHQAYRALNRRFHRHITPFDGRETVHANALSAGNGLAYIGRTRRQIELTPLDTRGIVPKLSGDRVVYEGMHNNKPFRYLDDEVLHISGLGNGFWGRSVVDQARNSLGLGLALQKHGNAWFRNGARPAGVLTSDKSPSKEQRAMMRQDFEEIHRGADNAHRVAFMPPGVKYEAVALSNEDSQWLESMRFSREEIAAWFNLPPHKLGALENSSVRANLEAQNRSYIETTLERWLRKWEQECERKLLTREEFESGDFFFRFNIDARLRGDIKTRTEAHVMRLQNGLASFNDIRHAEDENPVPHGDRFMVPLNMGLIGPDGEVEEREPSGQAEASLRQAVEYRVQALARTESEQLRRCGKKAAAAPSELKAFYGRWVQKVTDELLPFVPALAADELARRVRASVEQRETEIDAKVLGAEIELIPTITAAFADHVAAAYEPLVAHVLESNR